MDLNVEAIKGDVDSLRTRSGTLHSGPVPLPQELARFWWAMPASEITAGLVKTTKESETPQALQRGIISSLDMGSSADLMPRMTAAVP